MRFRSSHPATTGLVLLATAGIVWYMAPAESALRRPERDPAVALGSILPETRLESLDGHAFPLRRWLGGRPGLLIVTSQHDSASCAEYSRELRAVRARFPHLTTLVVATGADRDLLRREFGGGGAGESALVDPDRALLRHLGLRTGTVAVVADPWGRVVFADARGPGRASQYPVGRLLRNLASVLEAAAFGRGAESAMVQASR